MDHFHVPKFTIFLFLAKSCTNWEVVKQEWVTVQKEYVSMVQSSAFQQTSIGYKEKMTLISSKGISSNLI